MQYEYNQPYMTALQTRIREYRGSAPENVHMPFAMVLDRDIYMKLLDEMNTDYFTVPVHRYTECAVFQGVIILPDPVGGVTMLSEGEKFCVLKKIKL